MDITRHTQGDPIVIDPVPLLIAAHRRAYAEYMDATDDDEWDAALEVLAAIGRDLLANPSEGDALFYVSEYLALNHWFPLPASEDEGAEDYSNLGIAPGWPSILRAAWTSWQSPPGELASTH